MNQNLALRSDSNRKRKLWVINDAENQWINMRPGQAADRSVLTFEVGGVTSLLKNSEINNSLSIARVYPELNNEEVKGLAASIRELKKIKKSDFILQIADNTLIDIGVVTSKRTMESSRVELDIRWYEEVFDEGTSLPFKEHQVVQELSPLSFFSDDPKLMKVEKKLRDIGFEEISGHTKATFEGEAAFEYANKILPGMLRDEESGRIEVFYGTNRNRIESKKHSVGYGQAFGEGLIFGFCEVSIPKGHVQGVLERPFSFLRVELKEWLTDHVVVTKVTESEQKGFFEKLSGQLSVTEKKTALVFIPGFNTTFEEAAMRTAQIAWDLPFYGPAGFFSWPSTGKEESYIADGDKAEGSAPDFSAFLKDILNNTELEQLHIIAHSMGSRVLTFSLKDLQFDGDFQKRAHIIHQIILGAPDIDQDIFRKTLLPAFSKSGKGRTLYSSEHDSALKLSERLRGGRPRLGDGGKVLFVENGLDTVEASAVATIDSHSYIFNTKELLTDLFYLIGHGHSPFERRLKALKKNAFTYWQFPK